MTVVSALISLTHHTYKILTGVSGGVQKVPIRPWRSYGRRLRIHRETTERLLTDRRTSYDDPENEQDGYPLVTAGDPATTVPDSVRRALRSALKHGWGCLRTLDKPRSCGNVKWHPDALNAANSRLAYKVLIEATWTTELRPVGSS
jgi:hypothetical protein